MAHRRPKHNYKRVTKAMEQQVKDLYFMDGRMPIAIWVMTGINLDRVKRILGMRVDGPGQKGERMQHDQFNDGV